MCGIVSVIAKDGSLSADAIDFFEKLLYHDTIRGPHSTGVMAWCPDRYVHHRKEAVAGPEFLESDVWAKMREKTFKNNMPYAIVGHNRWATVGAVNRENSHPFLEKKNEDDAGVMLVHNGTLDSWDIDNKLLKEKIVDSKALAYLLSGEADYAEILGDITGAWSLAWFDLNRNKMMVGRNTQRPLAKAEFRISGKEIIAYASELEMLDWLLERTKKVYSYNASKVIPFEITEYSMNGKATKEVTEIKRPFRWNEQYGDYSGYSGYGNNYNSRAPASSVSKKNGSVARSSPKDKSGVEYKLGNPNGNQYTFKMGQEVLFLPFHFEPSQGNAMGRLWGHTYDTNLEPIVEICCVIYGVPSEVGKTWEQEDTLLATKVNGKTLNDELVLSYNVCKEAEGFKVDPKHWTVSKVAPPENVTPITVDQEGNAVLSANEGVEEDDEDEYEYACDWCATWTPSDELRLFNNGMSVCEICEVVAANAGNFPLIH